ncbi:MAG: CDP-alcohol phosphatidyltransferase [Alphaproteobacteria bacterium]|nr:CDP-alcohol phosphatidyltransferase [Alphaproteobacteria bacterium]
MASSPPSPQRRLAAWGVHLYTALGLPLAFLCVQALVDGDAARFFVFSALACAVDASDGFLARKVGVKEVLPGFSGRRLDDIVDYLHFVCLPLAALPALGLLPAELAWVVVVPLMASAYGFCQEQAKTEESFVGFPSYWNVLALYLYVLGASTQVVVGSLLVLSALVFVPIHYVYPSRTRFMQRTTVGLGLVWTAMVVALSLSPHAAWAVQLGWVSLFYPAYYVGLSLVHHRRVHGDDADGDPPDPADPADEPLAV